MRQTDPPSPVTDRTPDHFTMTDTAVLDIPTEATVAAPAATEPAPQPKPATPRKPRSTRLTPSEPTPPAPPPLPVPELPPAAAWKFFQLQADVLGDRHHGPLGGRGLACALGSFDPQTWSAVHEAGRRFVEAQYREACLGLVAPPLPPAGTGGYFSGAENARAVRSANANLAIMDRVQPAASAAEADIAARQRATVAELERVAGPLLARLLFLQGAYGATLRLATSVDMIAHELLDEGAIR